MTSPARETCMFGVGAEQEADEIDHVLRGEALADGVEMRRMMGGKGVVAQDRLGERAVREHLRQLVLGARIDLEQRRGMRMVVKRSSSVWPTVPVMPMSTSTICAGASSTAWPFCPTRTRPACAAIRTRSSLPSARWLWVREYCAEAPSGMASAILSTTLTWSRQSMLSPRLGPISRPQAPKVRSRQCSKAGPCGSPAYW